MFATVCINNCNRSMAAHLQLQEAGFRVCSFGTGARVTFPGRTATTPRIFNFTESYETMYAQLAHEDPTLFHTNGVLSMLERNMQIKKGPDRWQLLKTKQLKEFDIVICLDYQVFIAVLEDIRMRLRLSFQKKQLHIICLEVEDTTKDAQIASDIVCTLCTQLQSIAEPNEMEVKQLIINFEKTYQVELLYVGLHV